MTTTADKLLTTAEVAEILQVHQGTLHGWRRRKVGPKWVKFGDSPRSPVRYRAADVDAYLRAHQNA